jgi:hypothetical protein
VSKSEVIIENRNNSKELMFLRTRGKFAGNILPVIPRLNI